MSIQRKSNNIRLLESLDYVDIKYVDELVGGLRLPKESAAPSAKRSFRASVKYAALIAACALLLGAAIPVAGTLIRNITSGTAAAGDEQNLPYQLEQDLQVKEQTGDAFDGTPLFAVMNTEDYLQPVCEIFTADGKKINFCVCGETPCSCFSDKYLITVSGSNIYYLRQLSNGITVAACDASDPENIRVVKRNNVGLGEGPHSSSFGAQTHDIYSISGTSYFYAYSKAGYDGHYVGLSIIDISLLLDQEDEGIHIRTISEFGNLHDTAECLYNDSVWSVSGYFGMKDAQGAINQIGMLHEIEINDGSWIQPRRETVYKALFNVDGSACSDSRSFLEVDEDGSVHYYQCEKDDKSANGYSLYQYIYREGEKTAKVLRAKNVSGYIVTDGYIYYSVNGVNNTSDGKIYRLPACELDYKPMTAVDLGEEYENVTFLQGADGGIAVGASKKAGDATVEVILLIGAGENGITMTELPDFYIINN